MRLAKITTLTLVGLVATSGLVAGTSGAVFNTPAAHAEIQSYTPLPDAQRDLNILYTRMNAERAQRGLPPLVRNPSIEATAQLWASKMAVDQESMGGAAALRHSPADIVYSFGNIMPSGYSEVAENIGVSPTGADPLHEAYMNSAGHRAAILNPKYNNVGIAVAYDRDGKLWSVTQFGAYNGVPTANRIPPGLTPAPSHWVVPTVAIKAAQHTLAGPDRYATAAAVSTLAAPGTKKVVIVNGDDGAVDAVSGGPLAKATGAAIVLVSKGNIPQASLDLIRKNGVQEATILGGKTTVSDAVEYQLRAYGVNNINRIAGIDRYETSVLVSQQPTLRNSTLAFVSGGNGIADAVSVGGVAGRLGAPIVLAPPSGDGGKNPMYDSIRNRGRVVVTGSSASVSDQVYNDISGDERLGGSDRYATSLIIARWAANNGVPTSAVSVTTAEGNKTVDALSAASLGNITLLSRLGAWGNDIRNFANEKGVNDIYTIGLQTPTS